MLTRQVMIELRVDLFAFATECKLRTFQLPDKQNSERQLILCCVQGSPENKQKRVNADSGLQLCLWSIMHYNT